MTNISLEDAFWDQLGRITGARGTSIASLGGEINNAREGRLSSAIRLFVLENVKSGGNDDTKDACKTA